MKSQEADGKDNRTCDYVKNNQYQDIHKNNPSILCKALEMLSLLFVIAMIVAYMYYVSFFGPFSIITNILTLVIAVIYEIHFELFSEVWIASGQGMIMGVLIALVINVLALFIDFHYLILNIWPGR